MPHDPLSWIAIGGAVLAAPLLLWYLVRRPPLGRWVKVMLLFAIGVLPLMTAASGNIAGYEATKARRFCGSCHVMGPYARDSEDPMSHSLAAIHARNQAFGDENCYQCHADYGMFGTVTTKIGGMGHVYLYLTEFHKYTIEEALPRIHLKHPFQNKACTRCHSMEAPLWNEVRDHQGAIRDLERGTVSCVGNGCHGPAHPFSKPPPAPAPAVQEDLP